MIWPWQAKRVLAAVQAAANAQMKHEAVHPEPYDAEQRLTAVCIGATYRLKQVGVSPPSELKELVQAVLS